jgi:hypothetical protein
MHCWLFRMKFSNRPGVTEASFYIDLKANLTSDRDVFANDAKQTFYQGREPNVDVLKIFPESKP